MAEDYQVDSYSINPWELQEAKGLLHLFTSPVVMIFYGGKEYLRHARIIDFRDFEYQLRRLLENI